MNKRILMRIDFQNDFVHPRGNLSVASPELIEKHRQFAHNLQVGMFDILIDSYDTHFSETYRSTIEAQKFPPHCIFGSWGWHSAAPLKDNIKTVKIFKSTTNIWHEKQAYAILAGSWAGKEVFLCGVLSDICVRQAMDGLLKRGANVTILEDLCQGAERQISAILNDGCYRPFLEHRQLRAITSGQFFRAALLEKKIKHNLVHTK